MFNIKPYTSVSLKIKEVKVKTLRLSFFRNLIQPAKDSLFFFADMINFL